MYTIAICQLILYEYMDMDMDVDTCYILHEIFTYLLTYLLRYDHYGRPL